MHDQGNEKTFHITATINEMIFNDKMDMAPIKKPNGIVEAPRAATIAKIFLSGRASILLKILEHERKSAKNSEANKKNGGIKNLICLF